MKLTTSKDLSVKLKSLDVVKSNSNPLTFLVSHKYIHIISPIHMHVNIS